MTYRIIFIFIFSIFVVNISAAQVTTVNGTTFAATDTDYVKVAGQPDIYLFQKLSGGVISEMGRVKKLVKNGKVFWSREGVYQTFYPGGNLMKSEEYHNDTLNGLSIHLSSDNRLETTEYFNHGLRDGIYKYYHQSVLSEKANYKNGKLNGRKTTFYDNTAIKEDGFFVDGIRDSTYSVYYSNGRLLAEYNYKLGIYNGSYKTFFENGDPQSAGSYVNGIQNGTYIEWNLGTYMALMGHYNMGKKDGEWQYWDGNKKLIKTEIWKDDVLKKTK